MLDRMVQEHAITVFCFLLLAGEKSFLEMIAMREYQLSLIILNS